MAWHVNMAIGFSTKTKKYFLEFWGDTCFKSKGKSIFLGKPCSAKTNEFSETFKTVIAITNDFTIIALHLVWYAKVFPLARIRIGYKICHQCNGTYNWGIRHTNITNRGQWAFGCSDTCMHDTGYGLIWSQKHARGRKCCVVCKVCRCQDLPGSVSVKLSHLWWQVCYSMKCSDTKKRSTFM